MSQTSRMVTALKKCLRAKGAANQPKLWSEPFWLDTLMAAN